MALSVRPSVRPSVQLLACKNIEGTNLLTIHLLISLVTLLACENIEGMVWSFQTWHADVVRWPLDEFMVCLKLLCIKYVHNNLISDFSIFGLQIGIFTDIIFKFITVGTPYNTNVGVQKIPDRAIWKPVVAKRNNTNPWSCPWTPNFSDARLPSAPHGQTARIPRQAWVNFSPRAFITDCLTTL